MRVKPHYALGILAMFLVAGCAENRYRWNLTHAYVTPWTHLSPADRDAIIRLISYKDQMPIIGITEHPPDDRGATINVYTGNVNATYYRYWHGYALKKEGGTWRITFDGDSSHTVAGLDLSGEFRKWRQKRDQ